MFVITKFDFNFILLQMIKAHDLTTYILAVITNTGYNEQ